MKWRDSLASNSWLVRQIVTAFNIRGDVPQDMGSLLPSSQLLDMSAPEYVVPGLGRLMTGRCRVNAVAAQQPYVHLAENTLGAQVIAVVERVTVWHSGATGAEFQVAIAPIQGVYGTTGVSAYRDGRSPTTAVSTFLPVGGTAAAPAGNVNGESIVAPVGAYSTINGPWVLTSGQNNTLEVLCGAQNVIAVVSFQWRERPILKSEAFVQ